MSATVGQVVIQTIYQTNTNTYNQAIEKMHGFQKEGSKTEGIFGGFGKALGGIGVAMAGAFAIDKIVEFGKSALELGSNLNEIQNVVDVTFGAMAENVNEFSKQTLNSVGIGELAAKKYTSYMGAMLKSSGLSIDQSLKMSKAMTSLSGDMASFYNISTDDAYEKLRSGMAGETEPLKQLGINMSVANMQAYALTQGITKNWNAMSQAEQTALRYNYVLSVTKDAQGDFMRTQDSWANQTRLLGQNFDQLKMTIGQGLVAALLPVVKMLNQVVLGLQAVASFAGKSLKPLFGIKDATDSTATGAGAAAKAVGGVTAQIDKASTAAKKMRGNLAFDDVVSINKNSGASGGANTPATGGYGGNLSDYDYSKWGKDSKAELPDIEGSFKSMVANINKYLNGIGFDSSTLSSIVSHGKSIGDSIAGIFKQLTPNLKSFGFSLLDNLKTIGVSTANLALGIGEGIFGGIDKFFSQNKGRLTSTLADMLSGAERIGDNVTGIFKTLADLIGGFFKLDTSKQAIADFIAIASDLFLKPKELLINFVADVTGGINKIFSDNKDKLGTFLEGMSSLLADTMATTKKIIQDTFDTILKAYDTYFKPALDNATAGISFLIGKIVDAFNTWILPTFKQISTEFSALYDKSIKPFVDQLVTTVGKFVLMTSEIYKGFIAPIIGFLIDRLAPVFSNVFKTIWDVASTVFGGLLDWGKGVMRSFGGVIDFLTGVFTGDWTKAWNGIKDIFGGAWDSLVGLIKVPINLILDAVNAMVRGINSAFTFDMPDWDILPSGVRGKHFGGLGIPTIPKLKDGALVTGRSLVEVAEAGNPEAVIPWREDVLKRFAGAIAEQTPSGRGGGNTYNVTVQNLIGEESYLREFVRTLRRLDAEEDARTGGKGGLNFAF